MADPVEDFLEVDTQIPGQNYCCLSFLSPEKVMKDKDAFYITRFLKAFCKDRKIEFEDVEKEYRDFTYKHAEQLQKDYDEVCDFKTNVRGVKVRGVYDTQKEATIRAKVLQKRDKNFHVFVGQVGYWLPWDPSPEDMENQEYQQEHLNTLVKISAKTEKNTENSTRKLANLNSNLV